MAIAPVCDFCKEELEEFGALLFSPPSGGTVEKFHLCVPCYRKVMEQSA